MQLRETETILMDGRQTDRECHECGEATFRKKGHELWCPNCFYVPDNSEITPRTDVWVAFREENRKRVEDSDKDRPRPVGGWHGAYWGDGGAYEYTPSSGFSAPR